MGDDRGDLGNRMKDYESVPRTRLIRKMPVIGRIDGKAFHTLTRGMDKPIDDRFVRAMQSAARYLCERMQGCRLAYVQSDEISFLLIDYATHDTQAWFDYDLQKMCSIAAALAVSPFQARLEHEFGKQMPLAAFDARFWNLPQNEVCNYFVWRQQDAVRNSISSLAQAHFSHKELHGKNSSQMQEMLFSQKGINWNDCPTVQKRGACVRREKFVGPEGAERNRWIVDDETPTFTQDRDYVERYLAPEWP